MVRTLLPAIGLNPNAVGFQHVMLVATPLKVPGGVVPSVTILVVYLCLTRLRRLQEILSYHPVGFEELGGVLPLPMLLPGLPL